MPKSQLIPIGNSPAGLCLTAANWQALKVNTLTFNLEHLLVKPGFAVLKAAPNVAAYLGWDGAIILNASGLIANKEGIITLTSVFDGSKIRLSYAQLKELILHLKPLAVLIPPKMLYDFPELWDNWDEGIIPLIPAKAAATDQPLPKHGMYCSLNDLPAEKIPNLGLPLYVSGCTDLAKLQSLIQAGIEWIEIDYPACLGMEGRVISSEGVIDLKEERFAMDFELIDINCTCPTCCMQFTKAYLHHLFINTPLLCQRFLIQHNVRNSHHENSQ